VALSEYSFSPEIPPFSGELGRQSESRQAERLRCWCETTGRDFYVRCLDLGRDGLFLQTLADLSPGTRMDIEIDLPGGDFAAHAEVVWRRAPEENGPPPGLGVQFLSVTDDSFDVLEGYLGDHHC